MTLLNRLVIAVLLLAVVVLAVSIVVLAWAKPDDSIDWLRDAVEWMDDNNDDLPKIVLTVTASLVALISLTLFVLEVVPPSGAEVKVVGIKTADAVLSTAAIAQRIEEAVRQVPNVADVKTSVRARRKAVEVSMDLHVDPEASLAAVADGAIDATRNVLAEKVHVELSGPPRVRLHYRELRLPRPAAVPAARPSAGPAAPPPPAEDAAVGESNTSQPGDGDERSIPSMKRVPQLSLDRLPSIIESILFVADEPVEVSSLVKALRRSRTEVDAALDELERSLRAARRARPALQRACADGVGARSGSLYRALPGRGEQATPLDGGAGVARDHRLSPAGHEGQRGSGAGRELGRRHRFTGSAWSRRGGGARARPRPAGLARARR